MEEHHLNYRDNKSTPIFHSIISSKLTRKDPVGWARRDCGMPECAGERKEYEARA